MGVGDALGEAGVEAGDAHGATAVGDGGAKNSQQLFETRKH